MFGWEKNKEEKNNEKKIEIVSNKTNLPYIEATVKTYFDENKKRNFYYVWIKRIKRGKNNEIINSPFVSIPLNTFNNLVPEIFKRILISKGKKDFNKVENTISDKNKNDSKVFYSLFIKNGKYYVKIIRYKNGENTELKSPYIIVNVMDILKIYKNIFFNYIINA